MNNIDIKIQITINDIITKAEEQNDNFVKNIKDEIIQKYINELKDDSYLTSNFNDEINQKINSYIISISKKDFEDCYYIILNNSLKENVNKQYSKIMKTNMDEIIELIESQKKEMENKIPKNAQDNNPELNNINNLLNKTLESINDYYKNIFNISNELDNDIKQYNGNITSKYDNLSKIINVEKLTIKNSVDNIAESIFNYLDINNFESISNNKFSKIKNELNKIKNFISSKQLSFRRLDDNLNNNEDEIIIEKIKDSSSSIFGKVINLCENTLHFIQDFDYNQYLNDCINNFNKSFNNFIKYVKKNYCEDISNYILNKFSQLNKKYLNYSTKINENLNNKTKEINQSISNINNLLEDNMKKEKEAINSLKNKIKILNDNIKNNESIFKPIDYNITNLIENNILNINIKHNNINPFKVSCLDNNTCDTDTLVKLINQKRFEKIDLEIDNETINIILDFNNINIP